MTIGGLRLRELAQLALLPVIVTAAVAAPAYVVQDQAEKTQVVLCEVAHSNREQLLALRSIADRLHLPHDFEIPEEPAPCVE